MRRLLCVAALVVHALAVAGEDGRVGVTWDDTAPLRETLAARGMTSAGFASYVERLRESNARRVREGDLDHLVFYVLQSTRFTASAPIEPALSAKALVDGFAPPEREAFFRDPRSAASSVPAPVRSRVTALLRAIDSPGDDARLAYFRALVNAAFPDRGTREAALLGEYLRAMKFVYEKEFVAERSGQPADAVADLYRARGLSTDTAVEAGFLVHQGLGVLASLEPTRRIRRVLIVGPGLDLAPRTSLLEAGPPESYQPWAVIDALLALGLSHVNDLEVVAADINPRVVEHIARARDRPPTLTLVSEIGDDETVTLSKEYRDYFAQLGNAIGDPVALGAPSAPLGANPSASLRAGHMTRTLRIRPEAARTLRAETLDVVTERLQTPPFDLVIATNVLPYFGDVELMLALINIAGMLQADGIFLHNEARPAMHDLTTTLGLPLEQSRHAIVATVRGARGPLMDSAWLHRRKLRPR